MEDEKKAIIESILFSSGHEVPITTFMSALEMSKEDIANLLEEMQQDYINDKKSGIELIRVNGDYQLATKKEFYKYLYPIFDNRSKPSLSAASMETLSIIAYNPKITRAEVESIRGVNSDGTFYKLLEYDLIEPVGKLDAPGRPTMYSVTNNFLKLFDLATLEDLPELPKYKLDENKQIVIDDLLETNENDEGEENQENIIEAPMPEREMIENSEEENAENK